MNRYMTGFTAPTQLQSSIPLTMDQINRVAPSIFQSHAHESRSDRYTYIPTVKVLEGLQNEGWQPFFVAQTRVRDESKKEFCKHMLRLRHVNHIDSDDTNELILLNSHDGTSSYRLMAGVFRFVCANGLMVGNVCNDVRVHHKGDIVNDVIEGSYTVLNDFEKIDEHKDNMKSLTLTEPMKEAFGKAALALRWDNAPIEPHQVVRPKRMADNSNDLWSTFNVTQENIIRGGQIGYNAKGKRSRTRAVSGIDQNTKINQGLWILAEEMKKILS